MGLDDSRAGPVELGKPACYHTMVPAPGILLLVRKICIRGVRISQSRVVRT